MNAPNRPTSQDVADLAGVSRTTVSYVINEKTGGNIRISDETRQKVWEAVEALNYQPSRIARALRTKRSNLLALMVPYIEAPYLPLLACAVQQEAEEADLNVVIYATRNDPERARSFVDDCIASGVDGFISQTYQLSESELQRLVEAGIAVVIHGDTPTYRYVDNVVFDEAEAVKEAVSYLVRKGHQRIGTVAGPLDRWTGRVRKQGYVEALQAHDIPVEEVLIQEAVSFTRGAGTRCMENLLSLPDPPTAVFAANDVLAVDALLVAVDSGLSVPEDVAIVGFDDTPEATMVRPKLTTVHKDVRLLGTTAVHMVLERINSDSLLPSRHKTLDYDIRYRESA